MVKEWQQFIEDHPSVKEWLKNRPANTQRIFARGLESFCESVKLTPDPWRDLDRFKARDLAWNYIEKFLPDHTSIANTYMVAFKSFYRFKDGELLPFDTSRGGKHGFQVVRKKAAFEHIPNKTEVYQLIDMASNLRDRAILLFLFQSGCRLNVLQHIPYGQVKDQVGKDLVTLKITRELDFKLRSRNISFYYTFLNGEAAQALTRYCQVIHKDSKDDAPLFSTKGSTRSKGGTLPISQSYVLRIVKSCAKKAGFDPKTMWVHSLRKAFRKIVRQANIDDDDDKEQLMGHAIKGSREAYYDKKDIPLIIEAYRRCNFTRELPHSELEKIRNESSKEIEMLKGQIAELASMIYLLTPAKGDVRDKVAKFLSDGDKKHLDSIEAAEE